MFCSRCGSEVSSKSRFCPSCGLDLLATTPAQAIGTGDITDFDIVREALASEYEIIEELGRGGMALVYRARERQLEREVAVKVLPFTLAFDAEFVERFQREARTSAALEHPNIVPIYRVGRAGRVIYFVMKYLRGGALSTFLAERRTLTPPEIRRILIEAGSALGYAAQRGIVHRDIKPDNIMFDEFGQCMLADFGIAKAASGQRLTGTGMSIGTPHYMSPEQARAQTIDGRSDLYSLGIVAYLSLTGQVPYDGDDSFSIGYKHITEPVPTPMLETADQRRLFEVIRRMLAKDPGDRYQSCEELVAALQADPVAPAGSIRVGGATSGVHATGALRPALASAGVGAAAASVAVPPQAPSMSGALAAPPGLPSPFVSQPTTPLASPSVDRRKIPAGRRATPRRVADRSLAMKSGPMRAWPWIVLTVVGGAAATFYYLNVKGFAPGVDAEPAAPSGQNADSSAITPFPLVPPGDTTRAAAPIVGDSATPAASTPPALPPSRLPADSGSLRLLGLPAGSQVLIDERPVTSAVTPLSAGAHVLAISAPQRAFYVDTIMVRARDTLVLTPELQLIGAGLGRRGGATPPRPEPGREVAVDPATCEPGPAYNAARCFDVRPRPRLPLFVPVPADTASMPARAFMWVKVAADGRVTDTRRLRSSGDPAFDRAVAEYALTTTWRPATKDGAPVEAWIQAQFVPEQ